MTFQIFPGQGVKYGERFGVVHQVEPSTRLAMVAFWYTSPEESKHRQHYNVIRWDDLLPAKLDEDKLERLQARAEKKVTESRGTRVLVTTDAVREDVGRRCLNSVENIGQRKAVVVISSDGMMSGGKCFHGVYIVPGESGDVARDCSICKPYMIYSKQANPGIKA